MITIYNLYEFGFDDIDELIAIVIISFTAITLLILPYLYHQELTIDALLALYHNHCWIIDICIIAELIICVWYFLYTQRAEGEDAFKEEAFQLPIRVRENENEGEEKGVATRTTGTAKTGAGTTRAGTTGTGTRTVAICPET